RFERGQKSSESRNHNDASFTLIDCSSWRNNIIKHYSRLFFIDTSLTSSCEIFNHEVVPFSLAETSSIPFSGTTTNNGEQSFTVVLKSNYLAVEGGIYIWC
ncbi:hypothetical protein glysoja_004517, partial [Glycine soja]